jgi:hypothetical protein
MERVMTILSWYIACVVANRAAWNIWRAAWAPWLDEPDERG